MRYPVHTSAAEPLTPLTGQPFWGPRDQHFGQRVSDDDLAASPSRTNGAALKKMKNTEAGNSTSDVEAMGRPKKASNGLSLSRVYELRRSVAHP